MLLILLSFFFQYKIVDCNKFEEKAPNFNETHLTERLHKSLIEVNAFLKDIQHNIHTERTALRTVDYEAIPTKDQDFMDYSLTNIWWNGSQATGANTPQTDFLPNFNRDHGSDTETTLTATPNPEDTTPVRHYYPPYSHDYVPKFTYEIPSNPPTPPILTSYLQHTFSTPNETISTPSSNETFIPGTYPSGYPLDQPEPWTPDREFIVTQPTEKPTDGTVIPVREGPLGLEYTHSWPSLTPPPATEKTKSTPYPWPSLKPPTSTTSTTGSTPDYDFAYGEIITFNGITATPSPLISSINRTLHPNISRYVNEWLEQITGINVEEWLLSTKSVDPSNSTRSNWLPEQRLYENASKYLSPAIHRQGQGPPTTTLHPDFATASEDPWMPTATAKQEQFFIEGPAGLVYLGTTPAYDENTRTTIVSAGIAYLPKELVMPNGTTVAGDVLYGDILVTTGAATQTPEDPYKQGLIKEMESNVMGYMLTYLIKLSEIIATKNPEHVSQVIRHSEKIVLDLFNNGRLAWFGEPLIQVTMSLGIFLSESQMDEIQSYASMMHHMLKTRKDALSIEVNSIIDYAELLYENDEGLMLFDIIKEFDDYPNISKNSFELADDLIEYFLAPFRRLHESDRRQALLDSVNTALKIRFPRYQRRYNAGAFKYKRTPSTKRFQNVRPRTKPKLTQKKNTRFKQHERSYIKRAKPQHLRPVHSEFNYENILRRKYDFGEEIFLQLRRTKPIPKIQKRFSVITSDQHERFRGVMTRSFTSPNSLYMDLGPTRRTTDYITVSSNFFLQHDIANRDRGYHKQTPGYVRLDSKRRSTVKLVQNDVTSFLNEMKKRFMIAQAKRKTEMLKLKAKVIKKIAEGSSYSDEESSLKINLISALLNRHNKTKDDEMKKSNPEPELESSKRLNSPDKNLPLKNDNDDENTSQEYKNNGI